jgi:putative phage-type endonuclease
MTARDEHGFAKDDEEHDRELAEAMVDDSRAKWLEERRKSIGSSDSPAILRQSPWASPTSVWADKTGSPVALPPETEERLRWGRLLEPVILAEYSRRRGIDVVHMPQNAVISHPDFPGLPMHATPDGEDEERRVVEVKNWSAFATSMKDLDATGVPVLVQIQLQHQMACMEREHGTAVILLGGSELWWRDVDRNERFVKLLERACCDFWEQYVVTGNQPAPDGHKATVRALERLHPDDSGETVTLPADARDWDDKLTLIRSELKRLKAEKAELENNIKSALGAATFGELPGVEGRYKWATQERKAHAVKASKFRMLRRVK